MEKWTGLPGFGRPKKGSGRPEVGESGEISPISPGRRRSDRFIYPLSLSLSPNRVPTLFKGARPCGAAGAGARADGSGRVGAVMRIGGEAPRRRAHSKPRREGHSPISGCCCLGPSSAAERQFDARPQQLNGVYAAGRSRRPAGVSPVVASRHNTMSSLRASATIIVLRVPPRASDARFQNHSVRGLPF